MNELGHSGLVGTRKQGSVSFRRICRDITELVCTAQSLCVATTEVNAAQHRCGTLLGAYLCTDVLASTFQRRLRLGASLIGQWQTSFQ